MLLINTLRIIYGQGLLGPMSSPFGLDKGVRRKDLFSKTSINWGSKTVMSTIYDTFFYITTNPYIVSYMGGPHPAIQPFLKGLLF